MSEELESIEVELDKDTIVELALAAHEKDMKFNDLIVELLKEAAEKDLSNKE